MKKIVSIKSQKIYEIFNLKNVRLINENSIYKI